MINWNLLKNPINWAIVILMLVLAGIGGHLLLSLLGQEPAAAGSTGQQVVATSNGGTFAVAVGR
jgi:hypothetical protein